MDYTDRRSTWNMRAVVLDDAYGSLPCYAMIFHHVSIEHGSFDPIVSLLSSVENIDMPHSDDMVIISCQQSSRKGTRANIAASFRIFFLGKAVHNQLTSCIGPGR